MSYYESRFKVNFNDLDQIKEKIKFCEILGIKKIILEPINNLKKISQHLRQEIVGMSQIQIFFRINLRPKDLNSFKKQIKEYNKFEDIISVESNNKDIQIHAARDSRVDIVSFSEQNILKTLTTGLISLIKQNNSFIEFSLAPLMTKNKALQSKIFRTLYRFLNLAIKQRVNYIISGNFKEVFDLRHPRGLISLCHSLLGLSINEAKVGFSKNPDLLQKRIKNRLDVLVIEDGVNLIKKED